MPLPGENGTSRAGDGSHNLARAEQGEVVWDITGSDAASWSSVVGASQVVVRSSDISIHT